MVNDTVLKTVIAEIINGLNLNYTLTTTDINSTLENQIGVYLTSAGPNIATTGPDCVQLKTLTIRLHTHNKQGGKVQGEADINTIQQALSIVNTRYTGVKILKSELTIPGYLKGYTTKEIPVFNAAFLIYYQ